MFPLLRSTSLLSLLLVARSTPTTLHERTSNDGESPGKSSFTGFFLTDRGCTCKSAPMPGTLYAGSLPHKPALSTNTSTPQNLPATNISLGVAGPPYVWYPPYAYLESRTMGIDRAREKLYVDLAFYDTADTDAIFSLNYDGSERTQILKRAGSSVGGVAVASEKEKLYYTEGWDGGYSWANDTRLRRANLDGSGIETLVDMNKMECRLANSTDAKCPPRVYMLDQVVLDEEEEYVYWTASMQSGIWRAHSEIPDGQTWANRTDIERLLPWANPAQFRVANGYIHWVDTSRNSTGNETYPFTSPAYKQSVDDDSSRAAELLFNVPLRPYEGAQGIVVDSASGETWVLLRGEVATLWRFDRGGKGYPFQIRDGMYVNDVTGFEVY